jgi:lysozyme family protein
MPTFDSVRASYRKLWDGMIVGNTWSQAATIAANRIISGRDRYKAVEKRTSVPWFFIGLCHMREGNFNFGTYLGNGQAITRPTTIVPLGRGPFASFEDGAIDALKYQGLLDITDWSLERIAYSLEGFNGFGYRAKGVNTPYLWSGTNRYTNGKYVADHVFDASAVDKQLGSMAVLSKLCALDAEVNARINGGVIPQPAPPDIHPTPKPPAPPITQKHIGIAAAIGALGAAVASFFTTHPFLLVAIPLLVVAAFILSKSFLRRD